jgi:hypothetical protein
VGTGVLQVFEPQAVQRVGRRYTDSCILGPTSMHINTVRVCVCVCGCVCVCV